jgi:glycosyltransferase involved in cell wall biosynthesis
LNSSDRSNNIILFTKDKPALEGSGKSIRLMNWLAHLSHTYLKIYCIYFHSGTELDTTINNDYPSNVEFIPIQLIRSASWTTLWRRVMPFNPDQYSLFWYMDIPKSSQDLIAKLLNQNPDLLFFRLYLYPVLYLLLGRISKQSKVSLDIDDVESETFGKILRAQWTQGYFKEWLITRLGYHYMKHYEKSILPLIDTLYYANPLDQSSLHAHYPNMDLQCFPNKVMHQSLPVVQHKEDRINILFCGALNYFPNVDAIHFLVNEIWPIIIKEFPFARLTIAGSHPGIGIKRLLTALPSACLISDPLSMKDVFLNATIIMVPLRIGGGTRIKILQAFSYGIPVVTTSVGISGIQVNPGGVAIIKNDATAMANATIELLHNVSFRNRLALNAYDLYEKHYSFELNS